jgi:hypothetical protein
MVHIVKIIRGNTKDNNPQKSNRSLDKTKNIKCDLAAPLSYYSYLEQTFDSKTIKMLRKLVHSAL